MKELKTINNQINDFKKLKEKDNYYYVDKTFLIKQLVKLSDSAFDIF